MPEQLSSPERGFESEIAPLRREYWNLRESQDFTDTDAANREQIAADLDKRAFELYSDILSVVINNPEIHWQKLPKPDSFAGPYNQDFELQIDTDVALRFDWMTQPRNAQRIMLMPDGVDRETALKNRLDILTIKIWGKGFGPMGVQGDLGISISRKFGTDEEYQFSERMTSQFQPQELDQLRTKILTLKTRLLSA